MLCSSSSRSTGFFLFFFLPGNRCVSVFTAGCRGSDPGRSLKRLGGAGVNISAVEEESNDNVDDNGVFFFPDHTSTPLSCRPDTCGYWIRRKAPPPNHCPAPPLPTSVLLFILLKNLPPSLPLSGASTPFGYNYTDEEILVAAAKPAPNLHHH